MDSRSSLTRRYQENQPKGVDAQSHARCGVQNISPEMRGTCGERPANVQNARPINTGRPVVSGLGHAGAV